VSTIDALAGAARMQGWSSYASGMCLEAVWNAYGSHPSTGPHAGQFPYALKGWQYSTKQHPGDRNVPAGAPVYFTAGGNGFGHIAISLGGNRVVSTDIPSAGRVGITTLEDIEHRWGRTYLGWTGDFLGYDLVNLGGGTAPASGGGSDLVRAEQMFLDVYRGEKLTTDGVPGPATKAAIQRYQTFLRGYGYTGAIDGIWGDGTQAAHGKYYAVVTAPAAGPTVQAGATGGRVSALQAGLNRVFPSYSRLAVDGQFGNATKAVVQEFQRRVGITADGVVGPVTTAKLNSYGITF
jgi:hypothetical protein